MTSLAEHFSAFQGRYGACVGWLLCLAACGTVVVSYQPYQMAWDELYLVHRAIAVHAALWNGDVAALREAVSILSKSPLLVLLPVAAGPTARGDILIGFALFFHSALTWLGVASVLVLLRRLGKRWLAILLASAALLMLKPVTVYGGTFLADVPLGWSVLLLALWTHASLVKVEALPKSAILRGLILGALVSVGALTKVTFGLFAAIWLPVIAWTEFRRTQLRSFAFGALGFAIGLAPAAFVWFFLGKQFLSHAVAASWGGLGEFYRDTNSVWELTQRFAADIRWAWLPLSLLAGWAIHDAVRTRASTHWLSLLIALPFIVYLALYFLSPNRDDRFILPLLLSLPFLMALPTRPTTSITNCTRSQSAMVAVAILLATLPVFARPQLDSIRRASALLENLRPNSENRMLLCTDRGHFNIETFILAQEIRQPGSGVKTIVTSVYDEMHKRPIEFTLDRLKQVRTVIVEWPIPTEPAFTNTRANSVLDAVASHGVERTEFEYLGVRVFQLP